MDVRPFKGGHKVTPPFCEKMIGPTFFLNGWGVCVTRPKLFSCGVYLHRAHYLGWGIYPTVAKGGSRTDAIYTVYKLVDGAPKIFW